jgi:hypothetical protein
MKNHDINQAMPSVKTLSECPQEEVGSFPAHSNDKPDAKATKKNIDVRFVPLSQSIFEIRIQRGPVKKPAQPQSYPVEPVMLLKQQGTQPQP